MAMLIVDTNILLDSPQIVEDKNEQLVVTTGCLRELDGLKRNINPDTSFNARRAAIYLSRNLDNIQWEDTDGSSETVDDQLLTVTKKYDGILLTNDIYLKVKAEIQGIKTRGYSVKDSYSGVKYWLISTDENLYNEDLERAFNGEVPEGLELNENQYVVVKDLTSPYENKHGETDYAVMGEFLYKEGKLVPLKNKLSIQNKWIDYIQPRNAEQSCLFDALSRRENTIVYAGGRYGSGY